MMAVGGGGQASQLTSKVHVVDETGGSRTQSRVRDLAREELEEAVELVGVSSQRGQADHPALGGSSERIELKLVAEEVDPAEDAHGVTFGEARIE